MGIHLRQVCLVAHELQPAIGGLSSVLGVEVCHVDPGVGKFGLENALLAIGSNFLEVVAPIEDGTAAGRFLEKRKGDGGYIIVCQVDRAEDQEQCRQRAAARGVRTAYESNHGLYHLMQLHPADLKNAMWEIDWDENAQIEGIWEPAGGTSWQQHVKQDVSTSLTGVELQCDDPKETATLWAELAGLELESLGDTFRLRLASGEIRFVPNRDDRGPGLSGIDVTVRDQSAVLAAAEAGGAVREGDSIEVCGTRLYLSEA